jgi:hypothetical protein
MLEKYFFASKTLRRLAWPRQCHYDQSLRHQGDPQARSAPALTGCGGSHHRSIERACLEPSSGGQDGDARKDQPGAATSPPTAEAPSPALQDRPRNTGFGHRSCDRKWRRRKSL